MAEKTAQKWNVDKATKKTATANAAEIEKQVKEIEKSGLGDALKQHAISALRSESSGSKAFSLAIARAATVGTMDLVEVSGGFKAKQLSPNLLRAIVDNTDFVRAYLKSMADAD